LGSEAEVEVDTGSYGLEAGDILLLCSDGLTSYVEDQELAHIVLTASDIQIACDQLVNLARRRGGRDNISVVMAKVEGMKC
jgi:protein phosphatase